MRKVRRSWVSWRKTARWGWASCCKDVFGELYYKIHRSVVEPSSLLPPTITCSQALSPITYYFTVYPIKKLVACACRCTHFRPRRRASPTRSLGRECVVFFNRSRRLDRCLPWHFGKGARDRPYVYRRVSSIGMWESNDLLLKSCHLSDFRLYYHKRPESWRGVRGWGMV